MISLCACIRSLSRIFVFIYTLTHTYTHTRCLSLSLAHEHLSLSLRGIVWPPARGRAAKKSRRSLSALLSLSWKRERETAHPLSLSRRQSSRYIALSLSGLNILSLSALSALSLDGEMNISLSLRRAVRPSVCVSGTLSLRERRGTVCVFALSQTHTHTHTPLSSLSAYIHTLGARSTTSTLSAPRKPLSPRRGLRVASLLSVCFCAFA